MAGLVAGGGAARRGPAGAGAALAGPGARAAPRPRLRPLARRARPRLRPAPTDPTIDLTKL